MEWRKDEGEDEGGCTWVELYALYAIHGGEEDEESERTNDPLKKPQMLQAFKGCTIDKQAFDPRGA